MPAELTLAMFWKEAQWNTTYRGFVDNRDWAGLVNKYAPPSDGNDSALYARQITEWMAKYRAQLQ